MLINQQPSSNPCQNLTPVNQQLFCHNFINHLIQYTKHYCAQPNKAEYSLLSAIYRASILTAKFHYRHHCFNQEPWLLLPKKRKKKKSTESTWTVPLQINIYTSGPLKSTSSHVPDNQSRLPHLCRTTRVGHPSCGTLTMLDLASNVNHIDLQPCRISP